MLTNRLGEHLTPDERQAFLADNADRQEEFSWVRYYTAQELDTLKDSLSDLSISIDNLEVEKKEAVKDFADALKPLKERLKKTLKDLRNRSEQVTESCYVFHDYDTRQVGYYNAKGDLVNARPMRPQEMQGKLFHVQPISRYEEQEDSQPRYRTGTDD